jgi:hypothetical protein
MDIYTYISMNNPDAVNGVLAAYGYPRGKTVSEVEDTLKRFVREKRKAALMEIAEIHPDRELIEESITQSSPLLNYDGRGYNPMLQDLRTDTYWNKNARHRPIEPNFFYNANAQGNAQVNTQESETISSPEPTLRISLKHLILLGGFIFVGYAIMKAK